MRLLVAVHPATSTPPKVGVQRDGLVYELFVTTLPKPAFARHPTCWICICIEGLIVPVLSDEDREQDPDARVHLPRWDRRDDANSLANLVWNMRLELGQHLLPTAVRPTAFCVLSALDQQFDPATPTG